MIVIYQKPYDFPNAFIARVWEGIGPVATNTMIIRNSLHEIREDIVAAGFTIKLPRSRRDDPVVVETWMR